MGRGHDDGYTGIRDWMGNRELSVDFNALFGHVNTIRIFR